MSLLAPTLQAFFTDRPPQQRNASPHTVVAYRRGFCLLLGFVHQCSGKEPSRLDFADLGAPVVAAVLQHLESHAATEFALGMRVLPPFIRSFVSKLRPNSA